MKIHNNTVLITGGGSGIGLALAEAFCKLENKVIICGRNTDKLELAKKKNPSIKIFQCDVTDDESIKNMLENTKDENINILINNAGTGNPYSIIRDNEASEKALRDISTNLIAPVKLTKLFLPTLLKHPEAAIINITSIFALHNWFLAPGYSASKAGLHSFLKALRTQLKDTNVKVFEVMPPVVDTEMTKDLKTKKLTPESIAEKTLQGLKKNQLEITMGLTKLMKFLIWLNPGIADLILKRYPFPFEDMDKHYDKNNAPTD